MVFPNIGGVPLSYIFSFCVIFCFDGIAVHVLQQISYLLFTSRTLFPNSTNSCFFLGIRRSYQISFLSPSFLSPSISSFPWLAYTSYSFYICSSSPYSGHWTFECFSSPCFSGSLSCTACSAIKRIPLLGVISSSCHPQCLSIYVLICGQVNSLSTEIGKQILT